MDYALLTLAPFIGVLAMTASGYWGIGCGWLVVPALMIAGADAATAIAVSLLQIFPASIRTVRRSTPEIGWKAHGIGRALALPMCAAAMATALTGKHINAFLIREFDSEKPIQLLLALAMVYILANLFRKPVPANADPEAQFTRRQSCEAAAGGATLGVVSSTLGIGGGILVRPLLTRRFRLPELQASRVIRLLLLVTTTTAGITYLFGERSFNWHVLIYAATMALGGAVGFPLGIKLYRRVAANGYGQLVMKSYVIIALIVTLCLVLKLLDFHRAGLWVLTAGSLGLGGYFIFMSQFVVRHPRPGKT